MGEYADYAVQEMLEEEFDKVEDYYTKRYSQAQPNEMFLNTLGGVDDLKKEFSHLSTLLDAKEVKFEDLVLQGQQEHQSREICGLMATPAQVGIVEASKDEGISLLVADACAGAAKTSTLCMTASENIKPTLYLAFNKAMAEEAAGKFPTHVECRTTHSMAYRVIGHTYVSKLTRPSGKYVNVAGTGTEIAKYFHIDKEQYGPEEEQYLTPATVGVFAKATVARYESSSDETMGISHVPVGIILDVVKEMKYVEPIRKVVLKYAKKLWKERIDLNSPVLATHDTYFKLWQLSKPVLSDYEIILLDEAQDTTLCALDIVLNQKHAKIILVGDKRQAIYQWRGSVNAMEIAGGMKKQLNRSFRYGEQLALLATKILQEEGYVVQGNPDVDTVIGDDVVDKAQPYAILYRTNAALIMDAVRLVEDGYSINIEIDVRDFCRKLESAHALFKGEMKKVKHEEVVPYKTWAEYRDEGEWIGEISRIVEIVETFRTFYVLERLAEHQNSRTPHITLTTAHKSKGREFDQVVLYDDFPSNYVKNKWVGISTAEQNLLYVAATRAKLRLNMNSTAFEFLGYVKGK